METTQLLEIAAASVVIATFIVSAGALLSLLIRQSGPGSFMWHD